MAPTSLGGFLSSRLPESHEHRAQITWVPQAPVAPNSSSVLRRLSHHRALPGSLYPGPVPAQRRQASEVCGQMLPMGSCRLRGHSHSIGLGFWLDPEYRSQTHHSRLKCQACCSESQASGYFPWMKTQDQPIYWLGTRPPAQGLQQQATSWTSPVPLETSLVKGFGCWSQSIKTEDPNVQTLRQVHKDRDSRKLDTT